MNERGGPHFAVLQKSLFQTTCHKTYFVTSSHINTHLLSLTHTLALSLSVYACAYATHSRRSELFTQSPSFFSQTIISDSHTHFPSLLRSFTDSRTHKTHLLSLSLSFLDYDILTNELSGELAACQTSFGVG